MPGSLSEFERLFLLEFFVDFVKIQNSSFDVVDSTLCVSFQFLHYPVMRVCEEDFTPKTRPLTKDSKIIFKSGKSCLFSVHSDEHKTIPSQFNLVIAVCQSTRCGDGRILIGEATVNLGSSFVNLLRPPADLTVPSTGVRHDLFPLKDKSGKVVGSIAAFARISCFGKLIVTQFQLAAEDEVNYMFKGFDAEQLFEDDEMSDTPNIAYDEDEEEEEGEVLAKDVPYKEVFGYPKESGDECEGENLEGSLPDERPIAQGTLIEGPAKEVVDESKLKDEENYKEIGAEVNGHSIIIRVLKKRKKQKPSENLSLQMPCCCPPPEPPICPNAPQLNVCSCDYPLPPELIPRCPPMPCCCSPPPCCSPMNGQSGDVMKRGKSNSMKKRLSVSGCPKDDCPLSSDAESSVAKQMTSIEPGTISIKGDEVFIQSTNKPGEPISDKDKKLANSVYYKPNCNASSNEQKPNVPKENNPVVEPAKQPTETANRVSVDKAKKKKK